MHLPAGPWCAWHHALSFHCEPVAIPTGCDVHPAHVPRSRGGTADVDVVRPGGLGVVAHRQTPGVREGAEAGVHGPEVRPRRVEVAERVPGLRREDPVSGGPEGDRPRRL